jgi:Opacity protein and related surface antigens
MNKKLMGMAIAAAMGFTVTTASAGDAFEGSWYVVPGVSYMNTDSDLEADNGGGGFIRFGKELSEHWDVQIGAGHARADEDVSGANIFNSSGRFKQTLIGVDALYMFSRDKFRPFLMAGLGLAYNDVDYKINGVDYGDKKTSWMANVGLGAQYFFSDNIGLHLQADVIAEEVLHTMMSTIRSTVLITATKRLHGWPTLVWVRNTSSAITSACTCRPMLSLKKYCTQ